MSIQNVLKSQQSFFNQNRTKDLIFRKKQLQKLKLMILNHEKEITEALHKDLNKSPYECFVTETSIVLKEIDVAFKNLNRWARLKRKRTPLHLFGSNAYTVREPFGVSLILAPWNYPFQLALAPVVGSIAAGNTIILKCSRTSNHTSFLLRTLLNETFDPSFLYCVDENIDYDELLDNPYDIIFFTGSEKVGKIILSKAAQYCTPTILELGGKSPVIIDKNCNLKLACKRIVWGKSLNSGQTCIAPDYILVHASLKEAFMKELHTQFNKLFPRREADQNYPKIISESHYQRLIDLAQKEGVPINNTGNQKLFITPLPQATWDSPSMKDEIFGPLLPILTYADINDALIKIKERPKPLACYVFSNDIAFSKKIIHEISFGGGCINDCIMHIANHHLPFGGVGSSGMGKYHGYSSFLAFSHEKAIQNNTYLFDVPLRYPPYTANKIKWIRKIMK